MSKHSKATEEQLSELHGELAQFFKQKLRGGDATAAELGQIRQFLKDNRIEATIEQDPNMGSLATMLPTFEDEDDFDQSQRH